MPGQNIYQQPLANGPGSTSSAGPLGSPLNPSHGPHATLRTALPTYPVPRSQNRQQQQEQQPPLDNGNRSWSRASFPFPNHQENVTGIGPASNGMSAMGPPLTMTD